MAMDQRAKPTVATLSNEEKAIQEAQRLQNLEQRRLQRMEGDTIDSDSGESEAIAEEQRTEFQPNSGEADVDAFSLGSGLDQRAAHQELGVEDEDDFVIDEDLVDIEVGEMMPDLEDSEPSSYDPSDNAASQYSEDEDYAHDLSMRKSASNDFLSVGEQAAVTSSGSPRSDLAFTFPCPQTHEEFLEVTRSVGLRRSPPSLCKEFAACINHSLPQETRQN